MAEFLFGVVCAVIFLSPVKNLRKYTHRDDTDPPSGRSGMILFIDYKTGGQYLGSPSGGITPRLDEHGRHICVSFKDASR